MRCSTLARAETRVGESELAFGSERQEESSLCPVRALAPISKQALFGWDQFEYILLVWQEIRFSLVAWHCFGAYATTKLIASYLPAASKRININRSSMNSWVYTDLRHTRSLTTNPTQYNSCLAANFTRPEQQH